MIRILIAALLLCSTAFGQSIAVSGGRASLFSSGKPEPEKKPPDLFPLIEEDSTQLELREIRTQLASLASAVEEIRTSRKNSELIIHPNPPAIIDEPAAVNELPKCQRRYLAMFTASWCGPCQFDKRTVIPQIESAGYYVKQIEMTDPVNFDKYSKRGFSYPTYIACDWYTGEWVSEPHTGRISLTTAKRMLGGSVQLLKKQAEFAVAPPVRLIEWPGWGTIDLETYNRNCNCSMCVSIRYRQQEYRRQLKEYQQSQTRVTPDQEGCPHALVETMLDQMALRDSDILGELGCGDGRILIAAARRGIRGIGVEIDPARSDVARRNVKEAGLSHLITIETGDALEFDMTRVTVATTFLYPPLLAKLSPMLESLRVVASPYHEVPGLGMIQVGEVWIYQNSGKT